MSFLKKTLGLFVEFDEPQNSNTAQNPATVTPSNPTASSNPASVRPTIAPQQSISKEDFDKFEKHFDKLLSDNNMSGVDYFEFWKMMDTLEAHIPDERARIAATFGSLSIQGLTKQKLVASVDHYVQILEQDKQKFSSVIDNKANQDIIAKENNVKQLEGKIVENSQLIQKLTKEITDAQVTIEQLKKEVVEQKQKIDSSKNGYLQAFNAILSKMKGDSDKFNSTL